jgi:hypothetical protein
LIITLKVGNCDKGLSGFHGKQMVATPKFVSGVIVGWNWEGEIADNLGLN